MGAIQKMLAFLFPPRLGTLRQPYEFDSKDFTEEGFCSSAQPRMYRDALDRLKKTGKL